MTRAIPTVNVGGFPTVAVTRRELAQVMAEDCMEARQHGSTPKLAFSSNGQGIALAGRDEKFAHTMLEADYIHADGMPLVFASKIAHTHLPERIATTDFFHDAARVAVARKLRFFFLGTSDQQNLAAATAAVALHPGLEIVGRHHGFFSRSDEKSICRLIVESRADVVWVALGKPLQEEWCVRNRRHLSGVGWLKTCGGLFSFLAGDEPRAPHWVQAAGLEWLHRALNDPKRLGWRYATTNPYALYRLLRYTDRKLEL